MRQRKHRKGEKRPPVARCEGAKRGSAKANGREKAIVTPSPASALSVRVRPAYLAIAGIAVALLVVGLLARQLGNPLGQQAALPTVTIPTIPVPTASLPALGAKTGATPVPAPAKTPNYLSTSGSKIVDAAGREVRLTGVNWFGMETQTFSPHGLWMRSWQDMLDQIAAVGFNTIRLPFSSVILDPNAKPMEGIDYKLNPDLRGLTALQIMDKIVAGAGQRGLKVILDQHRPDTQAQSKLWYTDFLPEAQWIADWQTLAKRYLGNDAVIGADLHNEPAGESQWGGGDPKRDWRSAAERAGNAIHDVNPNWLIIVEGVERVGNDGYWMGGNLLAAGANPVILKVPNKVVYSAHDYGPGVYEQEWFKDKTFPANMPPIWDKYWGYLVKQNIAPVLLGEFGGRSVSEKDREGVWQRSLLRYLDEHNISFTYWSFNPNSSDTGGILQDDWKSVNADKQALLASRLTPKLAVNRPDVVDAGAVAQGERKNALPAQPIKVQFATGQTDVQVGALALKLLVVNQTAAHVPLAPMELRYWLSPTEATLAGLSEAVTRYGQQSVSGSVVGIDWASTDGVTANLVKDKDGELPFVKVTFGDGAGAIPSYGKVEVQLRVTKPDKTPFAQGEHFSFRPSNTPVDDEAIGLYLWGDRVWGKEPAIAAAGRPTQDAAGGSADARAGSGAEQPAATAPGAVAPTAPVRVSRQAAESAGASPETVAQEPRLVAGATAEAGGSFYEYVVRPGESLRSIAALVYGDPNAWQRIAAANATQIADPDLIQPGQTLRTPVP